MTADIGTIGYLDSERSAHPKFDQRVRPSWKPLQTQGYWLCAPSDLKGVISMTATVAEVTEVSEEDDDLRRPLMTFGNIAWMNLGFFGVQYSFAMTQTAVNPLFLLLGADAHNLPILNIAGPITGLLIQPFIGAMSDKTWSDRWGKRKPYVLGGGLVCVIISGWR
jgi:hypothetical protein